MFRVGHRAGFLFVMCALLFASRARADSRTSSLSWVRLAGADSCVSTQDLARDVEERLGRSVFVSAAQADVSVEGHIEKNANGSGFHASISIRDAAGKSLGSRDLDRADASCDTMRAPLALIVATMIDPDAVLRKKNPPDAAPQPLPPLLPPKVIVKTETVYVPVETPAPSPPPERSNISAELDATFTAASGLLPNFNAGLSTAAFLSLSRFLTIIGEGTYFLSSTLSPTPNAHATFSFFDFGTGLCPMHLQNDRFRFGLFGCALFDMGVLSEHPTGFGGPNAFDVAKFFFAPELQVRATIRIAGALVAVLGVGGLVPLSRDSYVFDRANGGQALLFQQSQLVGYANLGIGVAF